MDPNPLPLACGSAGDFGGVDPDELPEELPEDTPDAPPDDVPVTLPVAVVVAGVAPLDGMLVFTGPVDGVLAVALPGLAAAPPVAAVADTAAVLLAVEEDGFAACGVALEGVEAGLPVPGDGAEGLVPEAPAAVLAAAGFVSGIVPVVALVTSFTSPGRASITGASRDRSRFGAAAGEGLVEGLFADGVADVEPGEGVLAGPLPGALLVPALLPDAALPAAELPGDVPGVELGFLSSVISISLPFVQG
jgi:hypothetical protein